MLTMDYYGVPLTDEKIIPGNTATGISACTYKISGDYAVRFSSGGTTATTVGTLITGATTTTASAVVTAVVLETGTFGAGTAAGVLYYDSLVGTFTSTENWIVPGGSDDGTFVGPHISLKDYPVLNAKAALISCKNYTAHFTVNGSAPTAAAGTNIGLPITANGTVMLRDPNAIRNVKFIDAVSGSASVIYVTCFF
jgi:hypothetical protein